MGSERYVLCMLCHPGNGAGLSGYGSKEGHGGGGGGGCNLCQRGGCPAPHLFAHSPNV